MPGLGTTDLESDSCSLQRRRPNAHCLSWIILLGLFALQHYGTHRIGFLFAPLLLAWLGCICLIGLYNTLRWNPIVVQALSPFYIYKFFKDTDKDGWYSLGGPVLYITGIPEFDELKPFLPIWVIFQSTHLDVLRQMAFTTLVYPSIVVSYMGEAAYLTKHHEDLQMSFYRSIPSKASNCLAYFTILSSIFGLCRLMISHLRHLRSDILAGICHRHISYNRQEPGDNLSNILHNRPVSSSWLLSPSKDHSHIRECPRPNIHTRGLTVITAMLITTCLMFLIITIVWKRSFFLGLLFTTCFGCLELLYFSACVNKVPHGGWISLAISMTMLLVMAIWHYGTWSKQAYELQNKLQIDDLLDFSTCLGVVRVSGIGLFYISTADGI
ncbi:hypothetical protein HPP92_004185 [Vanilla planifolia]|uniref:K+ potassium transporter integral membrane domain-containing protein n=1 Tax=Vanilla planifolia TaxID=51239 RepID=A0A835VG72_VANPL|nr:hypothetical protein HPP92_004185 [Vanilla planifolia]